MCGLRDISVVRRGRLVIEMGEVGVYTLLLICIVVVMACEYLGHAILTGRELVGDEPFAVVLELLTLKTLHLASTGITRH